VVAGGVHSPNEVAAAVQRDPVVAAHYKSLDVTRMRTTTVTAPRQAYVSYRMGDQVYWTKKRVRLAVGETLLTDGRGEVRARCGNRVSDVAQTPVAAQEPDLTVLDQPLGSERAASSMAGVAPANVPFPQAWSSPIVGSLGPGAAADSHAPAMAGGSPAVLVAGGPGSHSSGSSAEPGSTGTLGAASAARYSSFAGTSGLYADDSVSNSTSDSTVGGGSNGGSNNGGGSNGGSNNGGGSNGGGSNSGGSNGGSNNGGGSSDQPAIFIPAGNDDHGTTTTGTTTTGATTGTPHTESVGTETTGDAGQTTSGTVKDVPEPASLLLMGLGAAAAAIRARKPRP
jgi:hypothetical protein